LLMAPQHCAASFALRRLMRISARGAVGPAI
jgi:hypothetical protein